MVHPSQPFDYGFADSLVIEGIGNDKMVCVNFFNTRTAVVPEACRTNRTREYRIVEVVLRGRNTIGAGYFMHSISL